MTNKDITNRVMNKMIKVRAKTGKLIDWQKVDESVYSNPLDFIGLIKRVWNIAIGKKD